MSVILVSAGYDHSIRFWEALTGVCSRTIQHSESQVNRLEITNDKKYLAACGARKVHLYDIASTNPAPVSTFEGHTGNITAVAFQREGRWLCTSSEDGTVRVWDTRARSVQRTYSSPGFAPVNEVLIHPNQGELISCDGDGMISVWDLAENRCTQQVQTAPPDQDTSPLQSISCAADGSMLVAAGSTGKCYTWTMKPTLEKTVLEPLGYFKAHNTHITRVLLSGDCRHLATCSADHTAKVWGVPDPLDPAYASIFNKAALSPSSFSSSSSKSSKSLLPPDSAEGTAFVDLSATGAFPTETTLRGHQRWVWDCAFSADSAYLVTACSDHYVRLWDLSTNETVRQYNGHSKGVICVALNDV